MALQLLFIAFLALASSSTIPDAFNSTGVVDVSVISAQQADQLFSEIKANTNIPFGYPVDGCYARATAMALIAEKEKIEMGKVWATGFLRVKTDNPKFPDVEWGYHVAPVVYVKENGKKEKLMVFDPSLFDKPVTVDDWTGKMKADGSPKAQVQKVYYGARYQYGPLGSEGKKYAWHTADLRHALHTLKKYTTVLAKINKGTAKSQSVQAKGAR